MKVENRGKKAKKNRKLTGQCTICGAEMDCPGSMQSADGHFCARCTDLMAEGYETDELKMSPVDVAQHFEECKEEDGGEEMTSRGSFYEKKGNER